jgi:hypothetical protein
MDSSKSQMPSSLKASMILAFIAAFLLPVLETGRRWSQISDSHYFLHWFDDYIIAAILFIAAWRVFKLSSKGRNILIATWGFATGMALGSFFSQLNFINEKDPAPISSPAVAFIKALALIYCIVSLYLALKER